MIPVPLVAVLCASGGTILGCIIRQPEINKLKKQLKALQKDNSKIKKLVIQQQNALQKMIAERAELRWIQWSEKRKMDCRIRGVVLDGYLYKEYVDLLGRAINNGGNDNFSEEEKQFFELSTRLLEEGRELTVEENKALRDYVLYKYKREIHKKRDVEILEYVNRVCA